jgi:MraZ protein
MALFLSNYVNRLDAKGRISVPAPFRDALRTDTGECSPIVLRPSHSNPCIEAWPVAHFEQMVAAQLAGLRPFSQEYDDMALALHADAERVAPDKDGRIILSEKLIAHANLGEQAEFNGAGSTFQIWEPSAGRQRRAQAAERARIAGSRAAASGGVA